MKHITPYLVLSSLRRRVRYGQHRCYDRVRLLIDCYDLLKNVQYLNMTSKDYLIIVKR